MFKGKAMGHPPGNPRQRLHPLRLGRFSTARTRGAPAAHSLDGDRRQDERRGLTPHAVQLS